MVKVRSEFSLKLWSNVPKFVLVSLSLFIYLTYLTIYVIKLVTGSYDHPNIDSASPSTGLMRTMQTITSYSYRITDWVNLDNDSLTNMQKKGIIYLCVGHFLFFLYIISAVRTIRTSPGHIPEEWHTNTQSAVRNAIETEKRVLTNIHKTVQKRKQELLMDTAKPDSKTPVTTPNTLCDSIDENLNEDAESDLLLQKDGQKSNSDSPNSKAWSQANADRSSETAFVVDSKEKLEETNRIQRLTEQFGKIDDYERELTPERIDQMAVMNVMKYGNKRFCTHCQKFKPERTHHCSQCGVCILRMDHHCPWVNKCIGFYNYKYFFNMVFWAAMSVLFISITYVEALADAFVNKNTNWFVVYVTMLSYLLTVIMTTILCCFVLFHFWLACKGRTTLEFCEKRKRGNYDKGILTNLRRAFGNCFLTWLLPVAPNLEGGGLTF